MSDFILVEVPSVTEGCDACHSFRSAIGSYYCSLFDVDINEEYDPCPQCLEARKKAKEKSCK
jgi:hypothetical protein